MPVVEVSPESRVISRGSFGRKSKLRFGQYARLDGYRPKGLGSQNFLSTDPHRTHVRTSPPFRREVIYFFWRYPAGLVSFAWELVSAITHSITILPAAFRTAIETLSLCTSIPIYLVPVI